MLGQLICVSQFVGAIKGLLENREGCGWTGERWKVSLLVRLRVCKKSYYRARPSGQVYGDRATPRVGMLDSHCLQNWVLHPTH